MINNNNNKFHCIEHILSSVEINKRLTEPLISMKADSKEQQEMGVNRHLNIILLGTQKVGKSQIID